MLDDVSRARSVTIVAYYDRHGNISTLLLLLSNPNEERFHFEYLLFTLAIVNDPFDHDFSGSGKFIPGSLLRNQDTTLIE